MNKHNFNDNQSLRRRVFGASYEGGKGGVEPLIKPYTVVICNLPNNVIQRDIEEMLNNLKVKHIRLIRDKETDVFKGYCYVEFEDEESFNVALEFDRADFVGNILRVNIADNRINDKKGFNGGGRRGGFGRGGPQNNNDRQSSNEEMTTEEVDYPEMESFMNESSSNVVFAVDGHRVPAIKSILSLKSRVFKAMFSGNFCETKQTEESKLLEIPIKDTTVDAFKTLIAFIYTNEVVLRDEEDFENICEVYRLSDRYEVLRLKQKVEQHLELSINMKHLTSISKPIFIHNIEKLMSKVLVFIDCNINEVIEWDINELKELNDSTNDKLLDELIGHYSDYNSAFIICYVGKRMVVVRKETLLNKNALEQIIKYFRTKWYNLSDLIDINTTTFDAFKTFVGFLYFDKLIIKDEEDLELIREVCRIAQVHIKYKPFDDCIGTHLEKRITVENLELISGIAFDYKIDGLMKRVNDFTKENFTEIIYKSKDILVKIDASTDNSLLEVLTEFARKTLLK